MRLLIALLVALVLVGCGDEVAQEEPEQPDPGEPDEPEEPVEEGDVVEGTLGGDPQLEGGCAWLDADGGRYEVIWPDGYEIGFDPLRLLGPDGETVATEGEVVRVRGRLATDVVSICQVGEIYQATEVVTD
jgi:hypothetical protein